MSSKAPNRAPLLAKAFRNFRYSGFLDDAPIDKFLYRFEALAYQYGISINKFAYELSALLEGTVQEFYWNLHSRNPFMSWPELKNELISAFQFRRSDIDIKSMMKNRKQRPREPFIQFYKDVFKMSLALHIPLSQNDFLEILTDNMCPSLQLEFAGQRPTSVGMLVQKCNEIEELWNKLNYYPDFSPSYKKTIHELL